MNNILFVFIGIIIGLAVAGCWFLVRNRSQTTNGTRSRARAFMQQREFYRNVQQAIRDFSQFCKQNPTMMQPYLVLGNLYRIAGEPQRSLVIHQNILTESDLPKPLQERALLELANDFVALGVEDQAVKRLEEIHERSQLFVVAQEKIVDIHFSNKDYDKSFAAMEKILKRKKTWRNRKRAAYFLAMAANNHFSSGELPTAKKTVKQSLSYDRECVLAIYLRTLIALEEKKYDEAIESAKSIIRLKPEFSFLAIPKIEDAYYQKQSFMRLGETIEELSNLFPTNPFLTYSLSKYYRKKKRFSDARRSLQTTFDVNSFFLPAYEEVISLNEEEEAPEQTVSEFSSLLEELRANDQYFCTHCDAKYQDLTWCCEQCGRWETIVRDLQIAHGPNLPSKDDERPASSV